MATVAPIYVYAYTELELWSVEKVREEAEARDKETKLLKKEDQERALSEGKEEERYKVAYEPKHTDAFDGFFGKLNYYLFGPNVGNARYDIKGNYRGPAINMGIAPVSSFAKGVKILQYGGHTLNNGTLKALQITKEEGKIGIEAMKKANQLPPNFHGNIGSDGSFWSKAGEYIDNILDYIK